VLTQRTIVTPLGDADGDSDSMINEGDYGVQTA
jgi:hypothetical protein